MLYNDSDRDRQSDLRAVRDVLDATASRWFIAMHIQLGSLICKCFWLRQYFDALIYMADKFIIALVWGYVNIGSDTDDEIVLSQNV